MKKVLIFLLPFVLASCSSVRLRYDAEFRTDTGIKGNFVMEKSYPVGAVKNWCYITFWIYGGGCWAYFGLPFDDQIRMMNTDAELEMRTGMASDHIIVGKHQITRISWEEAPPSSKTSSQTAARPNRGAQETPDQR